jgi:RNA polymerase sigma factor (sigma-70 family)
MNDIQGIRSKLAMVMPAERLRLVKLCTYLTGNGEVAEDLAQETLIEGWRQAHKLYDWQGYRQWLSAIARNICLRWARQQGQEYARIISFDQGDPTLPDKTLQIEALDLELRLEQEELAELIDRALAMLPSETRLVLVERYLRGVPHAETAARLGISEGTVAVRLHRGKAALHQILATKLHQEAASYGLVEAAPAGWRQTRMWCPSCGQAELLGRLEADKGLLAFRCPHCCIEPGLYISYADRQPFELFGGMKGYKPAFSRLMGEMDGYYREAITHGTAQCRDCGRTAKVGLQIPEEAPPTFHAMPGLHLRCLTCQAISWTTLRTLTRNLAAVRHFWQQHPRMCTWPEYETELNGYAAFAIRFQSLREPAWLEVISRRDTFEVLSIQESAGGRG